MTVQEPWTYVGRVSTNGEPLLAMDAGLLPAWHTDERFDELLDLGAEALRAELVAGLAVTLRPGSYRLLARWRTDLPSGAAFARWLLCRVVGP